MVYLWCRSEEELYLGCRSEEELSLWCIVKESCTSEEELYLWCSRGAVCLCPAWRAAPRSGG